MPAGVSSYTPLANLTLGSTAATVTFSSISQSYRDLVLVVNPSATSQASNMNYRFNGDAGSNYPGVWMRGNGSVAASGSDLGSYGQYDYSSGGLPTGFGNVFVVNFMDYSATDKQKTVISRWNMANESTGAVAGRWASTSAITSLTVFVLSTTFAAGSTFSLYGVSS